MQAMISDDDGGTGSETQLIGAVISAQDASNPGTGPGCRPVFERHPGESWLTGRPIGGFRARLFQRNLVA